MVVARTICIWAARRPLPQHYHGRRRRPKHTSQTSIISSISLAYNGTSLSLPSCRCCNRACSSSLSRPCLAFAFSCGCFSLRAPPPLLLHMVSCGEVIHKSLKFASPSCLASPTCASQLILSMCSNTHSAPRVCHGYTLQRNQYHINTVFYAFRDLPYYAA